MHALARRLWPLHRSLTGDGVRATLAILAQEIPGLVIHEVPSGTPAFDWTVPLEWRIHGAQLIDPTGEVIVDLADSNLHVVSYSEPVDAEFELSALQEHLHSDAELSTAIPYVTSYYHRTWGFCLTQQQRDALKPGEYHARIDSSLEPGSLTYADLVIPGESPAEVFITTYICHPSIANNELSGPVVAAAIARWLMSLPKRQYTYRFVFAPETIGALLYAAQNLEQLRSHVVAGINLTCIGDDGDYSYLASRLGNTPIDRIGKRVVAQTDRPVFYTFLDRGSDERHYCAPGIDLPLISLMRTRYGTYPEYHTSLDDLEHVVTPRGLAGGFGLVHDCIASLEESDYYRAVIPGEPQLGKRGLYHTMHARTVADEVLTRTHVLAYCDGEHSMADIADLLGRSEDEVRLLLDELIDHGLVEVPKLQPPKGRGAEGA